MMEGEKLEDLVALARKSAADGHPHAAELVRAADELERGLAAMDAIRRRIYGEDGQRSTAAHTSA
jgi:hypothetical protein